MPTATAAILPTSHLDLLDRPLPAALTTHMPDGRLQSTVVWYARADGHLLINTMREFQKARNLRARRRATILVVEPGDSNRWIEVRCRVEPDDRDPMAHLDVLAHRYTGAAPYFGRVVPQAPVPSGASGRVPVDAYGGVHRAGVHPRGSPHPPGAICQPAAARECRDEPAIPASHRGLLERPLTVALSTRMPDGAAQTQPVWCSLDGNDVLVNTTRQRRKGRNLAADPRATVLAVDPEDSSRWIEIRGDVDLVDHGALDHLDSLTELYTGHQHYYGTVYPVEQRELENRVIARIHPRRVTCDAIHR